MTNKINTTENTVTHTLPMFISMFFILTGITLWGN